MIILGIIFIIIGLILIQWHGRNYLNRGKRPFSIVNSSIFNWFF